MGMAQRSSGLIGRRQVILMLFGFIVFSAFLLVLGSELKSSREREMDFAYRQTLNLARVLEGQIQGMIGKIDLVLLEAENQIEQQNTDRYPENKQPLNTYLARLLRYIPESQSLRVVNEKGYFHFDATGQLSPAYVGDRAYFLEHKNNPHSDLVLSEPIFARLTHNWVFTLSRRLDYDNGDFAGVIQAAISSARFENLFKQIRLEEGDLVALYDYQSRLIARLPETPDKLGQRIEGLGFEPFLQRNVIESSYEFVSPIDQIERVFSFKKVHGLPLVVVVGRAKSQILKEWTRKAWLYLASAVALLLILSVLIALWLRRFEGVAHLADQMAQRAKDQASRLRALLDSIPDYAWIRDEKGHYTAVNQAFAESIGREQKELLGHTPDSIWPIQTALAIAGNDKRLLAEGKPQRDEISLKKKDGSIHIIDFLQAPVRNSEGAIVGMAGLGRDITKRKRAEERIRYMAEHDALTDLPNRALLRNYLEAQLQANRSGAVLFMDIDHFKHVNDSLGHEMGDALLVQVSERLSDALDASVGMISRQGGDEFVVVFNQLPVKPLVEDLLSVFNLPFHVMGHEFTVSVSVGISCYPQDGEDLVTLLRHADTAMFAAKAQGRGQYCFFTAEMNAQLLERLSIEQHLHKALEKNELKLYFQPLMCGKTQEILGFETLIRWQHPSWGMVSPARFIPIAEESGLILPIGEWILKEACLFGAQLHQSGYPGITLAVNISAIQFHHANLPAQVKEALAASGFDPRCLELELTESVLIDNNSHVVETCNALKALGVSLALDDFGTGYSSLSYLRHFPLDKLKIDQSFVRELLTSPDDAAITEAILAMSGKLRLRVTAEGVETEEQAMYLTASGCDQLQGFYFARPMPAETVAGWLESNQLMPIQGAV